MPAYREARIAYSSVDDGDDHEKQISIDPVSLKQLQLMAPPELVLPKFVSCNLPGSAVSSPRLAQSPTKHHNARFAWEEANSSLRRSKSCGEGRSSSPAVKFIDIPSIRRSSIQQQQKHDDAEGVDHVIDDTVEASKDYCNSFKHPPTFLPRGAGESGDDKFKCRCLFLPSLSHKKKQVVFRQTSALQLHTVQEKEEPLQLGKVSFYGLQEARESVAADKSRMSTVSKAASLEKFSCGSWSSSALLESDEGGRNSYFDLPLELIRAGHDETDSPVRAAFVFEKNLKGVLKKTTSNLGARKSHASASNRHVRFSVSAPTSQPASPSCITPRLRKAREDFNAFLAAQDVQ